MTSSLFSDRFFFTFTATYRVPGTDFYAFVRDTIPFIDEDTDLRRVRALLLGSGLRGKLLTLKGRRKGYMLHRSPDHDNAWCIDSTDLDDFTEETQYVAEDSDLTIDTLRAALIKMRELVS